MLTLTQSDLKAQAARLIEVFECSEFTAAEAARVIGEGALTRLVSAGLVCEQPALFGETRYSNKIPREDANADGALG